MRRIQNLLLFNWYVLISHCYKEANKCVDALASIGCNHVAILDLFEQTPTSVSSLWLADVLEVPTPQLFAL